MPRYSPFTPGQLGNIHAKEAALAEISWQGCGRIFQAAITDAFTDPGFSLSDSIRLQRVSSYDPPNVECCDAGPSMRSVTRAVLEYWSRDIEVSFDWRRDPSLEGPCDEEWLDPPDTVAGVKAALDAGATKILVLCTSRQNRFDPVGRITAALAKTARGRVNVVCPRTYRGVVGRAVDAHTAQADAGRGGDDRTTALMDFAQARNAPLCADDVCVIVGGPAPKRSTPNPHPHVVADEELWSATAKPLTDGMECCPRVELVPAHSGRMLEDPDTVIDVGRWARATA